MLQVQNIATNTSFFLRINSTLPKLSAELENEIERFWLAEKNRRGEHIFNGRIFSASAISPKGIDGYAVEYRYLLAQRAYPDLFDILQIRPVAVSGLFKCADGIVWGRRASSVTQDVGLWELVPSGGVDLSKMSNTNLAVKIDFLSQILTELYQEVGVKPEAISNLRPFCLIDDNDSHVLDIGVVIESSLSYDEIVRIYQNTAMQEYDMLRLVPQSKLDKFLQDEKSEVVGVSSALMRHFLEEL